MVHRPDHATGRVQDDVEVDHGQRDLLADDAEQDEHVRDHHGREQLEEVLDPQMHDPEAPELGRREVVARPREEAYGVERRDRARRQEEQPRHVARVVSGKAPAQDAPQHEDPHDEPDRQQHLPQPREVEVLEALQPEPVRCRVGEHAMHAEVGADERPEHDHRERAEQREGELALVARLAAGDHRRQEDPGRYERRRDPEDRELDMPGPHEVVREHRREVEAEEVGDLRAVVLRRRAGDRLQQEERRHDEEEPRRRPLRRRQRDVARLAEAERRLLAAVPPQARAPPPERREQQAHPGQQRDQRHHRPHDDVRRRLVVDTRLGRPVIRVRVVVARPLGRRGPRRPGEERGQPPQLHRVRDRLRAQAVVACRVREVPAVVPHERLERGRPLRADRERPGPLVVAIGAEVLDRPAGRRVRARSAVCAPDDVRRAPQVVGGEVRAEVGAVPEDRPVLHEAVVQEHLLALGDVARRVEHAALLVDGALRDRRLGLVAAVGEQPHDEEPAEDHEDHDLDPALGDQQRPATSALHDDPLGSARPIAPSRGPLAGRLPYAPRRRASQAKLALRGGRGRAGPYRAHECRL